MSQLKRYDIKKLLANPDLRRHLIVESTIVTQAREGIEVTHEQAENSYYVVTEGEQSLFFDLAAFRTGSGEYDGRHIEFIRCLSDTRHEARFQIARRDFSTIEASPLAYDKLGLVGWIFRENPPLATCVKSIEQGVASVNIDRYVRCFWEVDSRRVASSQAERSDVRPWCRFAKGGVFSRFYMDVYLVVFAETDWETMRSEMNVKYPYLKGNASLVIHPDNHYFEPGLTWQQRNQRGFNARKLPPGCIFAHISSAAIPKQVDDADYYLGLLNSHLSEFMLRCFSSFGAWEVGAVRKIPVPKVSADSGNVASELAREIHLTKAQWDTGSETCTRFDLPWLLQVEANGNTTSIASALNHVLAREAAVDAKLAAAYARLNDAVYRLYGVNDALRVKIEAAIGERPLEIVWPQMEGKSVEQKRMEHVCRLLTHTVKCVLEEDEDGLVALHPVAQEPLLLERVRAKVASFFREQDPHALEIEVVNELKRRVKGYARAESVHDWLTDIFFDFHCGLYQQRPILWHLSSSQESAEPAFSVIVHYHRFDHDRLAKLRSVHVRDRLATLRREAAQTGKDGREDDRLELLAALEEVEAFDRKLARLQEGHHEGGEAGDKDYRILTPWKAPQDRPKGWRPDLDDGVKVNIAPLARTGLLRTKNKFGAKEPED